MASGWGFSFLYIHTSVERKLPIVKTVKIIKAI